ncbi:CopG family transcriptional regulator [Sulfolobales archaeon HS-7]|nr:CopG family transcriptional regulator [Sulfolobales archaeon HS-7]
MRILTVKVPEKYIEALDELVTTGKFSSRSEVIRAALGDIIRKELWGKIESS